MLRIDDISVSKLEHKYIVSLQYAKGNDPFKHYESVHHSYKYAHHELEEVNSLALYFFLHHLDLYFLNEYSSIIYL